MRRSSIIESEKQRRLEIEAALVPVSRGFADEHELCGPIRLQLIENGGRVLLIDETEDRTASAGN